MLIPELRFAICRPTQRAADGGWAARFLTCFAALGFSRFDRESVLLPTAANAGRWGADVRNRESFHSNQ
jgi:hypothetical protein